MTPCVAPDRHGCDSYRSAPARALKPLHLVGQLYEKDAKLLTAACSVPPRSNSPGFVPITAFAQMGGLTMDALPLTAAGYGYGDGTSFFVRNPILDQDYSFPLNSCKVRQEGRGGGTGVFPGLQQLHRPQLRGVKMGKVRNKEGRPQNNPP